jgi:CRISPR-associated endoribonuclease Cas6
MNRLAAASPLLLCNRRYKITAVDVSDPKWAGISTWADMEAKVKGSHIHFTFATPLLTATPGEPGVLDALPFPEPLPLFSRLEEQWYRHRGSQLGCSVDEMVQESRCVIADYHLRTVEVQLSGRPHLGYLGSITYEYLRPCISPLHALARLAFFTGSGYGTDHGMGVTRVVIPGRA